MAVNVSLKKRLSRKPRRGKKRSYVWVLRWADPATGRFCYESTKTADKTDADSLRKMKWAELNGLAAPRVVAEPAKAKATWKECRDALQRSMEADNLRPSSVADYLLTFDGLQKMFPNVATPADVTAETANEYKRRRSEGGASVWTIKGDLSALKAVFGKWLGLECGLLDSNPFSKVRPPKCDDPDVRIVSADESFALFKWFNERWNNWRLPIVYLEIAALLGWRATELASIRDDDLLADGFVRVAAATCKTRKNKYGRLPDELHADLRASAAHGYAFGRFSDELRRLLMLWRRQPHHAAKVRDFAPDRLGGWLQDELQRFHDGREKAWRKTADECRQRGEAVPPQPERFTLHDFRRTAITGLQMAGASEKDTSVQVGATPEVIRKHYEKLDSMAIAGRNLERRLTAGQFSIRGRALGARAEKGVVDSNTIMTQTVAS